MPVRVISSEFTARNGVVIVEADGQEEVLSAAAKNLAITAGQGQLGKCGVSGQEQPYPVDEDGKTSDELMMGTGDKPVAAYRCDYRLTGAL